jgi:hypothetical protein
VALLCNSVTMWACGGVSRYFVQIESEIAAFGKNGKTLHVETCIRQECSRAPHDKVLKSEASTVE